MAVAPISGSELLEVFVRSTNDELWHIWQTQPGAWSHWSSLGGGIQGGPSVVRHAGGGSEVFCLGTDGAIWHIWQQEGGWSHWESLGGQLTASPLAVILYDKRLAVYARGTDGQLWQCWQRDFFTWSNWQPMGVAAVGTPVAAYQQIDGGGKLQLFVRSPDGNLMVARQTVAADSTSWTGFSRVTGPVTAEPDLYESTDRRVEVFFPSVNGEMPHIFQLDMWNPDAWSQAGSFAGILDTKPAAIRNVDGRLEVFHIGRDKRIHSVWQERPNERWAGWTPGPLANLTGFPCVGINPDGRLEVFAVDDAHNLVHMWQQARAAGPWGHGSLGGASLGGLGTAVAELGRCSMWATGWTAVGSLNR